MHISINAMRFTETMEIIGQSAKAVAVDSDTIANELFVVGGESSFSILKVSIPQDICQIFSRSKYVCRQQVGCSHAQFSNVNNTKKTFCFSSDQKENQKKEVASSSYNHGKICGNDILLQRNCSSFESCDDCQSVWPHEKLNRRSCKWWAKNSKCIPNDLENNETSLLELCENADCSFADCESCKNKLGCKWLKVFENFRCIADEKNEVGNLECPKKCSTFNDCDSCLTSTTSEGGFECVWSSKINQCFSPAYKTLLCSRGACGLLLNKSDLEQCPVTCKNHLKCSEC
jgi:multipile epidermal growth factor-like domains protein 8